MAAGNPVVYDNGILNGVVLGNWVTDDHCFVLLTQSYTPLTTHDTYADISGFEIVDVDYSILDAAGETAVDNVGVIECDVNDADFGAAVTITAKYLVCVLSTAAGIVSGSNLLFYLDLNTDSGSATVSSSSGPFQITWNASGVINIQRAA